MFGTNSDLRKTRGSLVRLVWAGEVCVEEDPRKQCSGMAMGGAHHYLLPPLRFSASFLQNFASYCSAAATCWSPSASLVSGTRQM